MTKLECPKLIALSEALALSRSDADFARARLDAAQSPVRIAMTCEMYADSGILITTALSDVMKLTGKAAGDMFAAERSLRAANARLVNLINAR